MKSLIFSIVVVLAFGNTSHAQSLQQIDTANNFNPKTIIITVLDTVIPKIIEKRDLDGEEIFVMNIVKIDEITKEISLSISYIYNDYELDEANPVCSIYINDKIIVIRSKLEKDVLENYDFKILQKENYDKIRKQLCDTSFPIAATVYEDITAIVKYKKGSTDIEYIDNDFMVPKEYRKGDYDIKGATIYSEPIENFIDTVKIKTP